MPKSRMASPTMAQQADYKAESRRSYVQTPALWRTLAVFFYLLLAQGGSKNIKQPHCRRQSAARILRCRLLPKRQQRWSFLAGLCNHCVQCICIDQGKQVAEGQPYAKSCYHLLRT